MNSRAALAARGSGFARALLAAIVVVQLAACGGSTPPTQPPPSGGNPPINSNPPANTKPTIDAVAAQGRRPKQPPQFADVRETIDLTATVRDPETPIEELVYQWSAPVGTFTGTGRTVTWTTPDTIDQATLVTITLKVIENFGHPGQAKIFSQDTTATVTVDLHNSVKEVGDMAVRFLDRFSQPQTIKDWRDVMKDFKREVCPSPGEYDAERESVEDHIANYVMNSYNVGPATVSVNFGGICTANIHGDACASSRVMWNSTGPNGGVSRGIDHLTAVYAAPDKRWWLCSSRFHPDSTFDRTFYSRR